MIEVAGLSIPDAEVEFSSSRSSGPGGQHVNKTESRVTLRFDVQASPSLSDEQKRRITARWKTRITKDGVLQMHCQVHRSQAANRAELELRFATMLADALRERKRRRKTRPTVAARERRLAAKRQRGAIKRGRGSGSADD